MIDYNSSASAHVGLKRFLRKICLNLAQSVWVPSSRRYKLYSMGGGKYQKKFYWRRCYS